MKKLLSFVLSLVLAASLSVGASAAPIVIGSNDFEPSLDAKSRSISRTVKDKKTTYRIMGIYYPEESKRELIYVNRARRDAGLPALEWEPKLEDAAIQRAMEQYLLKSHDRPDGSDFWTVDSYVNGENLAGSGSEYFDAAVVTEGWLNSPDHYENIMGTGEISQYFVSMAAACVETDQGVFWAQLFHADKSAAAKAKDNAASQTSSTGSGSGTSSAITAKSIASDLSKAKVSGSNVSLTLDAVDQLELDVIKSAASWASQNNKNVLLTVPTLTSSGKAKQGMLTMNPASFTKNKNAVKTGVYVEKAAVKTETDSIAKKYPKANFSVIRLEQSGSYGGSVSVGAKANLSKLNTKSLMFYTYDAKTETLKKLDLGKAGYSIDKNNYLKFSVSKGGYIVVTDQAF